MAKKRFAAITSSEVRASKTLATTVEGCGLRCMVYADENDSVNFTIWLQSLPAAAAFVDENL